MAAKLFWIFLILPFLFISHHTFAQENSDWDIAILPFDYIGIDEATVLSAESILRMEINVATNRNIVPTDKVLQAMGERVCNQLDCAVDIGVTLDVSRVLMCNLTALGEKILVYYTLVDVASASAVIKDRASALYVEDLDAVLKRVALSVTQTKSIERTAEVGNITAEEALEPFRRNTNTLTGITFGYLYPQHGYDNDDRSFSIDFRVAHELEQYEIGMLFAARKGLAVNLFGNYLFTRKDICPYLGAAFGFHWISHERLSYNYNNNYGYYEESDERGDGFEFTFNGGVKFFRTYDFQILANLAYLFTLNDFDDRAAVFTVGLVW